MVVSIMFYSISSTLSHVGGGGRGEPYIRVALTPLVMLMVKNNILIILTLSRRWWLVLYSITLTLTHVGGGGKYSVRLA
jgi:hypothetical protein